MYSEIRVNLSTTFFKKNKIFLTSFAATLLPENAVCISTAKLPATEAFIREFRSYSALTFGKGYFAQIGTYLADTN